MAKLYQICCPKCNNKRYFNRYGKDAHGFHKYQCLAPDAPKEQRGRPVGSGRTKEYPTCPVCGKAMYVCITIGITTSTVPARTGSVGIPFLLYRALFIMQLADRIFIIAKGVFISYSPLKLFATTGLSIQKTGPAQTTAPVDLFIIVLCNHDYC